MRQFLAIPIPFHAREQIAAVRDALGGRAKGWRWVRPEAVHLTLRFLGGVDPDLDRRARPEWRRAVGRHGVLAFRLSGMGVFPPRGRPRILWAGVDEATPGSLAALAGSVESAARELGFEAETRRFRPHLTLARARGTAVARPEAFPPVSGPEIVVRYVLLFRSELSRTGARYTALERYALGASS